VRLKLLLPFTIAEFLTLVLARQIGNQALLVILALVILGMILSVRTVVLTLKIIPPLSNAEILASPHWVNRLGEADEEGNR
jgi:hypothetical protein